MNINEFKIWMDGFLESKEGSVLTAKDVKKINKKMESIEETLLPAPAWPPLDPSISPAWPSEPNRWVQPKGPCDPVPEWPPTYPYIWCDNTSAGDPNKHKPVTTSLTVDDTGSIINLGQLPN